MVKELKYANTNTYIVEGSNGCLLFDTGWAGTFPLFCRALGEAGIRSSQIKYLLISHFHPDHMGIAQEIADMGAVIVVMDVQREYIHAADPIFRKEKRNHFVPINDQKIRLVAVKDSRSFLAELGIAGEVLHTPGHSNDSISLFLDSKELLVGDLNPLYELELHTGDEIGKSWELLLKKQPEIIYYGHAKTARVKAERERERQSNTGEDLYRLVGRIMKYSDKGCTKEWIQKKTGAAPAFVEDVLRMYVTHQNVGVQGILDRIEIKGR